MREVLQSLKEALINHSSGDTVSDASANKSYFSAATPWIGATKSGYGYHGSIDGNRQFTQTRVINTAKK